MPQPHLCSQYNCTHRIFVGLGSPKPSLRNITIFIHEGTLAPNGLPCKFHLSKMGFTICPSPLFIHYLLLYKNRIVVWLGRPEPGLVTSPYLYIRSPFPQRVFPKYIISLKWDSRYAPAPSLFTILLNTSNFRRARTPRTRSGNITIFVHQKALAPKRLP